MSNNDNLSSPDKSVHGDGNSYLDHSTTHTDARDLSVHSNVDNSSRVDNSQHIQINVQGGDLSSLGLSTPKTEIKKMGEIERERLMRAINAIHQNRPNVYKDFLPKLKAMAQEFPDEDSAQYYYYLLMASGSPQDYVSYYKNAGKEAYWLTFWAYSAYKRLGRSEEAEVALSHLGKWCEQYTDNGRVIEAYGLIYDCLKRGGSQYKVQDAADLLESLATFSDYLRPLALLLAKTISSGELAFTGDSETDFYLKLFDVNMSGMSTKSVQQPQPAPAPKPQPQPEPPRQTASAAPTPAPAAAPVVTTIVKHEGQNYEKILKYVVAAAVVFGVYKACFSGSDDSNEPVQAQVENVAADASDENVESSDDGSRDNGSSSGTRRERQSDRGNAGGGSANDSRPTAQQPASETSSQPSSSQSAVQEPAQKTVAAAPEPAASEMSASELVSSGKRAMRNFDYNKALKDFQQAASKGSSEANYQLGLLYSNGNFNRKNIDRAISYMRSAANSGNVDAMYQLGMMYSGRDNDQAKQWLRKAAANGHSKAERALERFTN